MNDDASKKHNAVLDAAHVAIRTAQLSSQYELRFGVKPDEVHVSPKERDLLEWLKALPPGSKITSVYFKNKDEPK